MEARLTGKIEELRFRDAGPGITMKGIVLERVARDALMDMRDSGQRVMVEFKVPELVERQLTLAQFFARSAPEGTESRGDQVVKVAKLERVLRLYESTLGAIGVPAEPGKENPCADCAASQRLASQTLRDGDAILTGREPEEPAAEEPKEETPPTRQGDTGLIGDKPIDGRPEDDETAGKDDGSDDGEPGDDKADGQDDGSGESDA